MLRHWSRQVLFFLFAAVCIFNTANASNVKPKGSIIDYQYTYLRFKNLSDTNTKIGLQFIDSIFQFIHLEENDTVVGSIYEFKAKGHYLANKQLDSTIFYAIKASEKFNNCHFYGGQTSVLILIAQMYQVSQDYDNALKYFKKAEATAIKSGQPIRTPNVQLSIGLLYSQLNKLDSSNQYLKLAKQGYELYNETAKQRRNLASLYLNIGSNLNKQDQYYPAIKTYQSVLDELSLLKSANTSFYSDAYRGISYSYFYLKNQDSTLKYTLLFYNLTDSNSTLYNLEQANSLMSDAYLLKEDYQNAYAYLSKAYDKKDERYKQILSNNAIDIANKYNNAQLEKELALKQQKEHLLSKTNKRLTIALLAGVVLLSLLTYLFFALKSRSKQRDEANSLLQKTNEERGILLKEIHHRVKNNLQSISSMLNIQQRRLADPDSKKVLMNSRNRIKAMALIHQSFYENDSSGKVDLDPFLHNLSHELLSIFNVSEEVNITIDAQSIEVDLDTLIPLGMIINEVLTNSFKYGLNKDKRNEINIRGSILDEKIELIISDSGDNFNLQDIGKGLGSKLIESFAEQIKAEVSYQSNIGCEVSINIPRNY